MTLYTMHALNEKYAIKFETFVPSFLQKIIFWQWNRLHVDWSSQLQPAHMFEMQWANERWRIDTYIHTKKWVVFYTLIDAMRCDAWAHTAYILIKSFKYPIEFFIWVISNSGALSNGKQIFSMHVYTHACISVCVCLIASTSSFELYILLI